MPGPRVRTTLGETPCRPPRAASPPTAGFPGDFPPVVVTARTASLRPRAAPRTGRAPPPTNGGDARASNLCSNQEQLTRLSAPGPPEWLSFARTSERQNVEADSYRTVTNRVRNHPAGRLVVQGGSPRSAPLRLVPSSRVRRATGGRAIYPPGGDRRRSAATAGESGSPAHRRGCGGVRARVVGVRARAPPGPMAAPTVAGISGEQRYGRLRRGLSSRDDSPASSKTLTGLYLGRGGR
jgi:hypothetical protein